MERKLFGHRFKKRSPESEHMPGKPMMATKNEEEMADDNPPNYEGKEHVRYKDPGHSPHNIRIPEDEPHMKSHVTRDEEHEMEDNYHMGTPHQTEHELASHIKRARMKMDAPDQEDPYPLLGNITHNVGAEGEEDTSGEEEMGPNDMQSESSKNGRKKMIVAVMKKKMKKGKRSFNESGMDRPHVDTGVRNSY